MGLAARPGPPGQPVQQPDVQKVHDRPLTLTADWVKSQDLLLAKNNLFHIVIPAQVLMKIIYRRIGSYKIYIHIYIDLLILTDTFLHRIKRQFLLVVLQRSVYVNIYIYKYTPGVYIYTST